MCNSCNKHAYLMICHHANHSWIVSRNSDDNFSPLLKSRQNAEKNDHFQKEKMKIDMAALRNFLCSFSLSTKSTLSFLEKARKIKPNLNLTDTDRLSSTGDI